MDYYYLNFMIFLRKNKNDVKKLLITDNAGAREMTMSIKLAPLFISSTRYFDNRFFTEYIQSFIYFFYIFSLVIRQPPRKNNNKK